MINLFDYDKCADKERGKSLGGIGYLMKAKTCTHYIKANNINMFPCLKLFRQKVYTMFLSHFGGKLSE